MYRTKKNDTSNFAAKLYGVLKVSNYGLYAQETDVLILTSFINSLQVVNMTQSTSNLRIKMKNIHQDFRKMASFSAGCLGNTETAEITHQTSVYQKLPKSNIKKQWGSLNLINRDIK